MTNLAFDLDGCLYDWNQAVYTELVIYENLSQTYDEFWSGGYKTYRQEGLYWDNLCSNRHLVSNQPPKPGLVNWLWDLSNRYNIYYISNRPMDVFETTQMYMSRYNYPNIHKLFFTKDKAKLILQLEIDIMVEDKLEVADQVKDLCKLYLVKQPWNRTRADEFNCVDSILDLKRIL